MFDISSASGRLGNEHSGHAGPKPGLLPRASDFKEFTPPMHRLKTYVVEDSQIIRENLIATLEELVPIEVVGTAEDESTAVHWLTCPEHAFDLVIIDIFLKGGSGLGVLRAVSGPAHRCKLVVLSNYATQDMRRRCQEMGADRVFDKSNEIDALILYCDRLAAADNDTSSRGAMV
jgi:DNA-binding NarL/FixJ family response regulator